MRKPVVLALSLSALPAGASGDVVPFSRSSTLDISYFPGVPPEHYAMTEFGLWSEHNQVSYTDSLRASAHFNLDPGTTGQVWSDAFVYVFDAVAGTPYSISGSMFSSRGQVSFSLTGPGVDHSVVLQADPPASAPLSFSGTFQTGRYMLSVGASAGPIQVATLDFNAAFGVAPVCYANCDGSTALPILNVLDFICFQSAFAAGDPYANCDGSTTLPVLNVNDFICFQKQFAAGCQ